MDRNRNWKNGYEHLCAYYKEHGNANIPRNYICRDGYHLGNWAMYQRQIQGGKKRKKKLTETQVKAMEKLGFSWSGNGTSCEKWEDGYRHLLEYQMEYDSVDVQKGYVSDDGYALGIWLCTQRQRKRGVGTPLTEAQIRKLDSLHIKWEDLHALNWEDGLTHLREYVNKNGHANVKKTYRADDNYPLGNWVFTQRSMRRRGLLSESRQSALEALGIQWELRNKKKISK